MAFDAIDGIQSSEFTFSMVEQVKHFCERGFNVVLVTNGNKECLNNEVNEKVQTDQNILKLHSRIEANNEDETIFKFKVVEVKLREVSTLAGCLDKIVSKVFDGDDDIGFVLFNNNVNVMAPFKDVEEDQVQ